MDLTIIKKLLIKLLSHKSLQNFIILSLIALVQMLNNIILGRELSKEEFGQYSFVFFTIVVAVTPLLMFGQGNSILRYFSSKNISEYQWKKYLFIFLLFIIFLLFPVSFTIKIFYNLNFFWFYIIIFSSFIMITIQITALIFRSQGKFNISVILDRVFSVPFLLSILFLLYVYNNVSLMNFALLKVVSFFIFVPFFIYILIKWKSGKKKIAKDFVFDGLALWELSISAIILFKIDGFFIVKILGYNEMALYSVIVVIMKIYELSFTSLFNVYSQKFSKEKNINIKNFFYLLLIIVIIIGAFYIIFTDFILSLLFKGKYQAPFILIILFCIYNSVNLLYVLPSCYLIGHSNKTEMRLMLIANIVSIALKVILILILMDFGLSGFLMSGIIAFGFRTGAGYYIVFRSK